MPSIPVSLKELRVIHYLLREVETKAKELYQTEAVAHPDAAEKMAASISEVTAVVDKLTKILDLEMSKMSKFHDSRDTKH